jgi:hypothetical protein
MKNQKKPQKSQPVPKKSPASQPPRPAPVAATSTSASQTTVRLDSPEYRADLIEDQLKEIFYALGQNEEHLGLSRRRLERAPVAEKSETQ